MNNFSTGLIFGTVMGIALCVSVNPISKRDVYRNCHKANKMMKKMNRCVNHTMHNVFG